MKSFCETSFGKIWTQYFPSSKPKALVLSVSGSGEYRTVDTIAPNATARWLNSNHFDLLVYDKPGCGESDGAWKNVSLDTLSGAAREVCSWAKATFDLPLLYLGQSEGSKIGFEVALDNKDVNGFALRVPSHHPIKKRICYQYTQMSDKNEEWQDWEKTIAKIENGDLESGVLHGFSYAYWKSAIDREQPGDLVPKINAPLFVLNGSKDPFTPSFAFAPIHQAIEKSGGPVSKATVYEGVGHGLLNENEKWETSEPAKDILEWYLALLK